MKTILTTLCLAALLCGCAVTKIDQTQFQRADYPPPPTNHVALITPMFDRTLKDPESKRLRFLDPVKAGWAAFGSKPAEYGWVVKVWCNAKNSYGGYVGEQPYWFYFQGEELKKKTEPWAVPNFDWGADAK